MANSVFKKASSGWSNQTIEKKTSRGVEVAPTYKRTSSGWERIDQQMITQTKVIEGYAQWNGSYRNTSGTGTTSYKDANIYQGRYESYRYLGLMCFNDLFTKARNTGTIKKVEVRLKNNHAYYNSGLKTRIVGAKSLPSTRPNSASFSWSDDTTLSSDVPFSKGESIPKWITLNSTAISKIQNNQINGLKILSPSGFALNDYGYFEGSSNDKPYVKITVEYQTFG